ncbi:MAG: A/G-specific adenine glycosylase [Actinomycetaceae bacterium]|nr:A/G-specific adenine glycosylase [Actinomycetaceae bacterium]
MFALLDEWYARHSRPLPWREDGMSPWAILVCEVMSQQTPVTRVIPAWQAWLEKWPTPSSMEEASTADVVRMWGRLGYPRRALRLHECAHAITVHHDGNIPDNYDALIALPGIGPYTAEALLTFAFHQRSIVLDTNIRRVLARLHGKAYAAKGRTREEEKLALQLLPQNNNEAIIWNTALMELGALICQVRPHCDSCPLTAHCHWHINGHPDNTPKTKAQKYIGTHRQARGRILEVLRTHTDNTNKAVLQEKSDLNSARFEPALTSLITDGFIEEYHGTYRLLQ